MCAVSAVRWRGHGARFLVIQKRRLELWWSRNEFGMGGVGILVKEELCEEVRELCR